MKPTLDERLNDPDSGLHPRTTQLGELRMLTTVDIKGITVTAEQFRHFAIHPAVQRNTDTGEFFLDAATWVIHHIPSHSDLMMIHQTDPVEYPGHPLAIDLDGVKDFLDWLDQFADWSSPEPKPSFPDDAKLSYILFRGDPVFWKRPQDCAKTEP
jgi:hypothetical protein